MIQSMNKPTRFYSDKMEKAVAKAIGGKQQANSGATPFQKCDIVSDKWAIEAKTATTQKKSFSIKKEWLEKNAEEAFGMGKQFSALVFDFGDNGTRYYIIDEKTFIKLTEEQL